MKKLLPFIFLALLFNSCCKDHSDVIPGQNFIPEDILEEIENNGQVIYSGFNPPVLKGKYRLSPTILVSSNFADTYSPGDEFKSQILEFSNFRRSDLTLEVSIEDEDGVHKTKGRGGFIAGEGNDFTIYIREDTENTTTGHVHLSTTVLSGTVDANGIVNLHLSRFMIDDNGDPYGDLFENGNGRLFKDGDGYSEKF